MSSSIFDPFSALTLLQDITQDTRDYFEPETAERLNSMSHYTNAANNCFSLRTLDVARVAWGSSRGGRSDHCEFLCIDDTQLMVWIVAEVVAPNFFKYGKPARKAGLKFRPLLDADFEKAAHIVSTLSRPDKGTHLILYTSPSHIESA